MPTHFRNLSADEQRLVRLVQPHRELSTPKTRRYMLRTLGWSDGKFGNVQRALVDKGWPIKPYGETRTVHGYERPLYRLLKEEEHFIWSAKFEARYNVARTRTGRGVMRQGEREEPLSVEIFDEEQRLHVANNVLRGQRTPVPIGHSTNDPELKREDDGDEVLTEQELARLLAPMLKQHPNNR
jgi:hypothetical protein